MSDPYQKILERSLLPRMESLGFTRVTLMDCMRPEVLLRKGDLWFGTSWDCRDQYLELRIGGLYWFKDVMPRVVVLGEYSDHCASIKRMSPSIPNYLEEISAAVERSIEDVVRSTEKIQESEARSVARLRDLLISKVLDSELMEYGA